MARRREPGHVGAQLTDSQVAAAVSRLASWHLPHGLVAPLVSAAWRYRHYLTAADAICVVLAADLGGDFLTVDHRLAEASPFPPQVTALRSPVRP